MFETTIAYVYPALVAGIGQIPLFMIVIFT